MRKITKNVSKDSGVSAEIRTEHSKNKNLQHHVCVNPIGYEPTEIIKHVLY
jgi:hypothetical protein